LIDGVEIKRRFRDDPRRAAEHEQEIMTALSESADSKNLRVCESGPANRKISWKGLDMSVD
jgi:hypothetical protein